MSAPSLHAQAPAAAPPAPAPTAADMKGKTADQFYKKIEVLKGIPADQVHPAMEYITTALGVGCGYCHVIGHFDQDDKREKHVARSMIQMTMALNEHRVRCQARNDVLHLPSRRGQSRRRRCCSPAIKRRQTRAATEIFPPLALKNFTNLDASMSPSKAPATVMTGPPPAPKPAAPPHRSPSVADVFAKYEQALGGEGRGQQDHRALL